MGDVLWTMSHGNYSCIFCTPHAVQSQTWIMGKFKGTPLQSPRTVGKTHGFRSRCSLKAIIIWSNFAHVPGLQVLAIHHQGPWACTSTSQTRSPAHGHIPKSNVAAWSSRPWATRVSGQRWGRPRGRPHGPRIHPGLVLGLLWFLRFGVR